MRTGTVDRGLAVGSHEGLQLLPERQGQCMTHFFSNILISLQCLSLGNSQPAANNRVQGIENRKKEMDLGRQTGKPPKIYKGKTTLMIVLVSFLILL